MKKLFCLITMLIIGISSVQFTAMAEENLYVTRAEMAEKVVSFYEEMEDTEVDISDSSFKFNDVENHTLKDAIQKCYSLGYMIGTSDTSFEPDGYVTRAQSVAIIDRLRTQLENNHSIEIIVYFGNKDKFTDDDLIPEWAKPSAYRMKGPHFIVGDENKNFNATQVITEEQADSILERIKSLKIENSDEYAQKAFNEIFKFPLPDTVCIEEYYFALLRDEELDNKYNLDIHDVYEPSFIAKISFNESDLEYFLKGFRFDRQTEENLEEIDESYEFYTLVLNNIKRMYPWWDVPEISDLDYKFLGVDSGVIVRGTSKYILIKKDADGRYYLYVYRPA